MFEEKARKGAEKICSNGQCFCGYNCGREKSSIIKPLELIDSNFVCPLASYEVPAKTDESFSPFDSRVNKEDLFALCFHCSNTTVKEDEEYITLKRKNLTMCADCMVKSIEDSIIEAEAEAYMG